MPRRPNSIDWLMAVCALFWLAACVPKSEPPIINNPAAAAGGMTLYVMSNGWHTEIVLPRASVLAEVIPETSDFGQAHYFSFGWGDAKYFPAPYKSLGTTLRAALLPTTAVVHLAGLTAHPKDIFSANEIIELRISPEGFDRLIDHLGASFSRQDDRPITPGLYGFSRFYPATGKFHLLYTCNTWTAEKLENAGIPVQIFGTVEAEDLIKQIRQFAVE